MPSKEYTGRDWKVSMAHMLTYGVHTMSWRGHLLWTFSYPAGPVSLATEGQVCQRHLLWNGESYRKPCTWVEQGAGIVGCSGGQVPILWDRTFSCSLLSFFQCQGNFGQLLSFSQQSYSPRIPNLFNGKQGMNRANHSTRYPDLAVQEVVGR